ncbi:MAG UNVERIFIED_CONTAM: U32 family peptidase [Anaerolineae bacterium]|jgi:collagenase-like PrtC family protease
MGITTLKIEGRYKEADYVALTTQAYRQAVDAAWENRPNPITPSQELELEQVYSRGLGALLRQRDESSSGGERTFTAPSRGVVSGRCNRCNLTMW